MQNCRVCSSKQLYKFLDLGYTPLADQFLREEQLKEPVLYFPLAVMSCEDCGFTQLSHVVSPELLYKYDYPYESSTTKTATIHYHDFAESVVKEFNFTSADLAVDIGSNVGVLLDGFKKMGLRIQGVDPADNIAIIAEKRGVETINSFFNKDAVEEILVKKGRASVITGTNVFAHIHDLETLIKDVKTLLTDRGVFVIEAPHLLHLILNLEYDTIYHEHLSYISIDPLINFFKRLEMEVIKVESKNIHGGTIRIFVAREGAYKIQASVQSVIELEKTHKLRDKGTLDEFAKRVSQNRQDLLWLLRKLKHEGKKIVAVSAPAKGMTLLNYCKIGKETLDYVTEKSTLKIGRYTPGDNIRVFHDSKLLEDQPDYALLLAWNFTKEIMDNLKEYREKGGKFIIPIPTPKIV